jgi:thiosulfate dehydrogenase (quinone) large subunit
VSQATGHTAGQTPMQSTTQARTQEPAQPPAQANVSLSGYPSLQERGYAEVRTDRALAYLILRLGLGLSVMLHGLVRLSIYSQFIDDTVKQFSHTFLPPASVRLLAYTLPFFESAIGFLVLLGAATRYTLFLGALFMMPLLFGMNILQQWAIVEIQLVYVLLYFLLLFFREWNDYSVDGWTKHRRM